MTEGTSEAMRSKESYFTENPAVVAKMTEMDDAYASQKRGSESIFEERQSESGRGKNVIFEERQSESGRESKNVFKVSYSTKRKGTDKRKTIFDPTNAETINVEFTNEIMSKYTFHWQGMLWSLISFGAILPFCFFSTIDTEPLVIPAIVFGAVTDLCWLFLVCAPESLLLKCNIKPSPSASSVSCRLRGAQAGKKGFKRKVFRSAAALLGFTSPWEKEQIPSALPAAILAGYWLMLGTMYFGWKQLTKTPYLMCGGLELKTETYGCGNIAAGKVFTFNNTDGKVFTFNVTGGHFHQGSPFTGFSIAKELNSFALLTTVPAVCYMISVFLVTIVLAWTSSEEFLAVKLMQYEILESKSKDQDLPKHDLTYSFQEVVQIVENTCEKERKAGRLLRVSVCVHLCLHSVCIHIHPTSIIVIHTQAFVALGRGALFRS